MPRILEDRELVADLLAIRLDLSGDNFRGNFVGLRVHAVVCMEEY